MPSRQERHAQYASYMKALWIPDCHPPANSVSPVSAQKFFLSFQSSPSSSSPVLKSTTPCDTLLLSICHTSPIVSASIISDTTLVACDDGRLKDVLLPFQHYLLSPVLESVPCDITTTLGLPNFAICKRLSITSDTTLVASDGDSKVVFSDEDKSTMPHPGVQAPAYTTTNDERIDVPAPSTTLDIISPFCMPYIRPLVLLVDKCQTTPPRRRSRHHGRLGHCHGGGGAHLDTGWRPPDVARIAGPSYIRRVVNFRAWFANQGLPCVTSPSNKFSRSHDSSHHHLSTFTTTAMYSQHPQHLTPARPPRLRY
ncbi:hypothetical protein BDR03DRAFT_468131 [Suillus americanus]|nr:hypothetical protein BDR03DRAFT_468131 [Suillus americanus]